MIVFDSKTESEVFFTLFRDCVLGFQKMLIYFSMTGGWGLSGEKLSFNL